jgi:dolichol-phosphate mannosyltransferase
MTILPTAPAKSPMNCARDYPGEVFVFHRERKEGLGRAYVAAFQYVLKNLNYDFIMRMDSDFSHDPVYIRDFFAAIENADLVLGSRYITGVNVVNWDFKRAGPQQNSPALTSA